MIDFLSQIGKRLKQPAFNGSGGRGGGFWPSFARTSYSVDKESGPLWKSGIPYTCLAWERRNSIEAEICVQQRDAASWSILPAHPALSLLYSPNAFFDIHQLLDAVRFDYHLSGNGYLWKRRSFAGRVVELWWIPAWLIEPRWEENGSAFISCYEYNVNGETFALPTEDVIHFRNGIDPQSNGRKGLSTFGAVLREVCTDNEAGIIGAALCKNLGVPGVIISPKSGDGNEQMSRAQREQFKETWNETFRGEGFGQPFVQSIPVEITTPSLNLQELAWDKLRKVPEERISAAFGIPAVVLGLGAGLAQSSAKASHGDAREQAYESCILPTLYTLARTLTRSLMPEFGEDIAEGASTRIWFDLTQVRVLQADENERAKRLAMLYGGGIIKRGEAREAAGFIATPEDDIYKSDTAKTDELAIGGDDASTRDDAAAFDDKEKDEETDD